MTETHGRRGVLVVEDDDELRRLFGLVLEAEGFTVYKAGAGEAGLDMLAADSGAIHLMITDLGLPGLGGVELISRVRKASPLIKIIGTSGFGADNVRDMVLAAGADCFIPKPFHMSVVVDKVKSLLP